MTNYITTNCINQIHTLRKELKHQEIDGFEFYFEKENLLQELAHKEDKKELFYELFINDNINELSNDDKIVALTGITRYDLEKFTKNMFNHQNLLFKSFNNNNDDNNKEIIENEEENTITKTIKKYGNEIFEKLKNEILDLIKIIKDLIVQEVKDFLKTYSPTFKDLMIKLGNELIKYLISQINGGNSFKSILISIPNDKKNDVRDIYKDNDNKDNINNEIDKGELLLSSIINKTEFNILKKFAKKIKKLYIEKYSNIENKINNIISNMNNNDDDLDNNNYCKCF